MKNHRISRSRMGSSFLFLKALATLAAAFISITCWEVIRSLPAFIWQIPPLTSAHALRSGHCFGGLVHPHFSSWRAIAL
jgi:hypothetical protein